MNDDRLTGLLGSLRHERMDRGADERARRRLEAAWAERGRRRGLRWRRRVFVPALATVVLVVALGATILRAPGESPLYGFRVTLENAAVLLHPDLDDRARYLLALLDQRQTEAARLEAAGNVLAAARVREIERQTLAELRALLPQEPEPEPSVAVSPLPTPTPRTATPTPPPSAPTTTPGIGVPTATPRTTPTLFTARPTTPAPTPTPTPRPTPTPAGTPYLVLVSGTVKNADGTLNTGACVSLSAGGFCITTVQNGSFSFTASYRTGDTVTVYVVTKEAGVITGKAVASGIVRGATLELAPVKLAKP